MNHKEPLIFGDDWNISFFNFIVLKLNIFVILLLLKIIEIIKGNNVIIQLRLKIEDDGSKMENKFKIFI
jgi:hypothetical protein